MLYDYKTFDTAIYNLEVELEQAQAELKEPAPDHIMPQTTLSVVKIGQGTTKTPFDTSMTEKWGCLRAELLTSRVNNLRTQLQNLRRWRECIKTARDSLNHEESQLLWLRYDKEKSHDQAWLALRKAGICVSKRTYFNRLNELVEKVARFMGVIEFNYDKEGDCDG